MTFIDNEASKSEQFLGALMFHIFAMIWTLIFFYFTAKISAGQYSCTSHPELANLPYYYSAMAVGVMFVGITFYYVTHKAYQWGQEVAELQKAWKDPNALETDGI